MRNKLIITVEEIRRYLDNKQQVDMLILDFSKTFDAVPHTRLLRKLDHCGVRGNIHGWLESWLIMERSQDQSKLNLVYIHDIGENIGSSVRLFADDSLVYMAVSSRNDCQRLQDDLTTMVNWSKKWQMIFNPSKCYTFRITKGKQPVIYPFHIEGQVLESVNNNPYLGVELSSMGHSH